MKCDIVLTRGQRAIAVTVHFNYIAGSRGHRDRFGAPEEPDTPAEVEIEEVVDWKDAFVLDDLTDAELEHIETKVWDYLARLPQNEPSEPWLHGD